jgi:prepilin-type N-terminal cleavage/methylation domain-containing protein
VRTVRRATRLVNRTERGFSLIEVMFAIAFLGFGLLAVAQMIPLATRQVVSSKQLTDAVAAGQSLIEELKMDDYSGGTLTAGSHTRTSGPYTLVWVVTNNEPATGSKRIDLTVTWNSSGVTETATMSTYITR